MATFISGIASGLDWQSMVTQLMELERRPITLMEADKTKISNRLSAWNQVNTKLLSLKTAAGALSSSDDFSLYTPSASITGTDKAVKDLLTYAVGTNAAPGSYSLTINNLAQAQKLGSGSFDSATEALNLSGDVVINGRVLTIETTDTLGDIRNKINALNSGQNPSGVVASIFTVAPGEYRLTLTSQNTGSDGMVIANGSANNILSQLGLADDSLTLRSSITGGARSSAFASSTESIEDLLGLTTAASGSVTVAGEAIAIDLANDSLEDIKDLINANANLQAAGVSASIASSTEDGVTMYTLQIDGTQSFTDASNILQTLGILKQGLSDVTGVTGSTANTANGAEITAATLIVDIDGYNAWTAGDTITIQGTNHSGGAVGPTDFTITATSTMDDLLSAIEAAYGDQVTARVNSNGAIVVEDNLSGASSLTLTLSATLGDGNSTLAFGTFNASTVRQREIVAGEDAEITLDGVTITRDSNQISDLITGMTLNLVDEDDDATITLNVARDYDGIKQKIQDFVTAFNDLIAYVDTQNTVSEDGEDTPPLFADSSLQTVQGTLRSLVLAGVDGIDSTLDHLSLIGVNIDRYGKLSINSSKLDGYLRTNFEDIVNLFIAQGESTSSAITYVNSGRDTLEGEYEIEVTQAATRGSTTGIGFSGTLSTDSTLEITDGNGRVASIALSAGWNITSIVNAINSELSMSYQETRVGANSLYADATQTSSITADTTWGSVYDAAGASANLADGDVITFSGTNRTGSNVSGTYTISDIATDAVGDLLNAIEDAYGTGYDAYVDSQGRIAVRDTTAGDSQLTLAINTVKNLDFGEIDVDPTGADGSHDGRYSMEISAESDGGQLKIANDAYGSSSFTLAVTGGNLGMTDGTYEGLDAEGRMRKTGSSDWMTMTGMGQLLTGDEDQDVEGLSIKYTGTTTGTFDFTFITGVGEKFDRALHYMTDTIDGFVADKQQSMKDQMENIDLKIENMEKRISMKEQTMINKFVAMEKMLTLLQSQQQWLSGQINAMWSS